MMRFSLAPVLLRKAAFPCCLSSFSEGGKPSRVKRGCCGLRQTTMKAERALKDFGMELSAVIMENPRCNDVIFSVDHSLWESLRWRRELQRTPGASLLV